MVLFCFITGIHGCSGITSLSWFLKTDIQIGPIYVRDTLRTAM